MRLGLLGVGTVYTECTFTATDFRQAGFAYPRFDQCVFDDCDLEGVDFNASAFVNCSFVGRVESVFFRGGFWSEYDLKRYGTQVNPMRNVDFSRAVLEDVAFANGCDLATVIPPTNGSHMLFDHWQARLSRLRSEARGWPEADREQAALCAQVYGDVGQEWYLVNKADLVHVHGEAAGLRIASNLEQDLDRPVGVPPAKRV